MCGVVGFFDKKNQLTEVERQRLIGQMIEQIDHRGRDDRGSYSENGVVLGHTRLSILDLSKNGAQPFFSYDNSVVLSYNGEVYNYQTLNEELSKRHPLKSNCDTETIAVSYVDKGVSCVQTFNGMFAFSLYDKKKQNIVLAVDRFSIKPLYFIDTPNWFAWSSEAKSLLLLPGFKAEFNEKKLSEYLMFRQIAGKETLFKNIYRVLPAQIINFETSSNEFTSNIYWDLAKNDFGDIDYETFLLKKLESSVSSHLMSDVPVGVQLSGGLDSSLVAAIAKRQIKNLNTFSIGLKTEGWNEFEYSQKVAGEINTTHHQITFSEDDFCRELPNLTYFHDEPISHSHSVPMYLLAKEAAKYVKVLLSGEGADEVFFGYRRYLNFFGKNIQANDLVFSNAWVGAAFAQKVSRLEFNQLEALEQRFALAKKVDNLSTVDKLSFYDIKTYLPSLLLRQDKMGMAVTLENRVPFLDYTLVEFGFSLPENLKIDRSGNKILLKKVAESFISQNIIYRKKCGFAQPLSEWFKNKNGLGAFLSLLLESKRDFLNYEEINKIVVEHQADKSDHSEILWVLVNLEIWFRIFIDGIKPSEILNSVYR